MKKLNSALSLSFLFLLFFAVVAHAQTTPADYFVGSWNVKAYNLPQGDTDMIIRIEKKDGKLSGGIINPTTKVVTTPFTKVELVANRLTAYFFAEGTDVYLSLEKKDATSVTGSIMDMFKMEGSKGK